MSDRTLPSDPHWPRASEWLVPVAEAGLAAADVAVLGVPTYASSITPTGADATPAAIRAALARYSTYAGSRDHDLSELTAIDFGDVSDPDGADGESAVATAVERALQRCRLLVLLGGDNSLTYAAMRGMAAAANAGRGPSGDADVELGGCGLITVDAHHDLRDGESNGSPVRRLIDAGLPGAQVAQLGIADFSNSATYAERAREHGIHIVYREQLADDRLEGVVEHALGFVAANGHDVYVDLDADVCDRAEVPGCPSAAPGGISAFALRRLAYLLARDTRVRVIDITEIDARRDTPDERTVRLGALLVLEAAAGLLDRPVSES